MDFEVISRYCMEEGVDLPPKPKWEKLDGLYKVWQSMFEKCYSPSSPNFTKFGGRGIRVCDEWHSFDKFRDDLYSSYVEYSSKCGDITLHRLDSVGDFCLENCVWGTKMHKGQSKYTGETIHDFIVLGKAESIYYRCRCIICNTEQDVAHNQLLTDTALCKCRKGKRRIRIGNHKYTHRELEVLYNLTYEDIDRHLRSKSSTLFDSIRCINRSEWLDLVKRVHLDPKF